MKIKTIKNSLKIAAFSFFMFLGVQNVYASPGSWSEWFTVEQIGFDLWDSYGPSSNSSGMSIQPDGEHVMANPAGCSNTDAYDIIPLHYAHWNTDAAYGPMIQEIHKLVTLAYTAGHQIQFHVLAGSCSARQRPFVQKIQIKK